MYHSKEAMYCTTRKKQGNLKFRTWNTTKRHGNSVELLFLEFLGILHNTMPTSKEALEERSEKFRSNRKGGIFMDILRDSAVHTNIPILQSPGPSEFNDQGNLSYCTSLSTTVLRMFRSRFLF
jgi:hypothetical protein